MQIKKIKSFQKAILAIVAGTLMSFHSSHLLAASKAQEPVVNNGAIAISSSRANPTNNSHTCSKHKFDRDQIRVLRRSYEFGKPFGLGLSLAAIAWQESLAGRYLINVNDPSFGVHHILITSAANRSGVKGIEVNRLAMAIIQDDKLSASFAIKELLFWQDTIKKEDNNWINIWAAYNGGYNYLGDKPQEYGKNIQEKVVWLRTCLFPNK